MDNLQAELQAERLEAQRLEEELELAVGASKSGVAALATVGDRPDVDLSIDYGGLKANAFERGDQDQAGEYYTSLLEEAKRSGYRAGEVAAYHNLAVVARLLGNTEEAESYASSALETAKQIEGPEVDMISMYSGLQVTPQVESNLEQARQFHAAAKELAEKHNYDWGLAGGYLDAGFVDYLAGRIDQAEQNFKMALQLFQQEEDELGMAMAHKDLAALYDGMQRHDLAEEQREQIRRILTELNP